MWQRKSCLKIHPEQAGESHLSWVSFSCHMFEIALILQPTQFLCPTVALHFCMLSFMDLHEASKWQELYTNNLSTWQIHLLSSNTGSSSDDFRWTIYVLSCSNQSKLYRQQNFISVGVDLQCMLTAVVKKKNWSQIMKCWHENVQRHRWIFYWVSFLCHLKVWLNVSCVYFCVPYAFGKFVSTIYIASIQPREAHKLIIMVGERW